MSTPMTDEQLRAAINLADAYEAWLPLATVIVGAASAAIDLRAVAPLELNN